MRQAVIAVVIAFCSLSPVAAKADAPHSIVALLGPSVGYLLGQSDLCQWGLTKTIEDTYRASFKAIGMSATQQDAAWEQAKVRRAGLNGMAPEAQARMKADTCTESFRARFEQDLKN